MTFEFHVSITQVNGTCHVGLSAELDLSSAINILEARDIRDRLLIDCRRVEDMSASDLALLASLAARGDVALSHVAPQLERTLRHDHLEAIVTVLVAPNANAGDPFEHALVQRLKQRTTRASVGPHRLVEPWLRNGHDAYRKSA